MRCFLHFSTLLLPILSHNGVHIFDITTSIKVVWTWGAFSFFTCKCAWHDNGVQFFISHLASWLRTRRFSEPTFRPSGATNHWKNTVFHDFPTFSRTWIFFLLTLSLSSPLSAFHLSILSEVWLLNFLRIYTYTYIVHSIVCILLPSNLWPLDPATQKKPLARHWNCVLQRILGRWSTPKQTGTTRRGRLGRALRAQMEI